MKRGRLKYASETAISEKRPKILNNPLKATIENNGKGIVSKKKNSSRFNVRDIFNEYTHYHDYQKYEVIKRGKSSVEMTNERIATVKRIEDAIQKGLEEITTFEFFNFVDPLGSGSIDTVDVDIKLVSFDSNKKVLNRNSLFRGKISCAKYEVGKNVVYYPVPSELQKSAEVVYLVCTVRGVCVNENKDRRKGRGQRASRSSSKESTELKTFYGVKKIMQRKNDELEVKHMNGSILLERNDGILNLPFNLDRETWKDDLEKIQKLCQLAHATSVKTTMPSLNFETSDQHVEEDWEDIEKDMRHREKERVSTPSRECKLHFVLDKISGSPNKENGAPTEVSKTASRFFVGVNSISCPFTLKTFPDTNHLIKYLNAMFSKLSFRLESPNVIAISEGSCSVKVVTDPVVPAVKNKKKKWEPGLIPYMSMPFANIIREPMNLYPGEEFVLHRPSCGWYADNTHRRIWEFIDATDKEKMFMERFDIFFAYHTKHQPVSKKMKRLEIERFIRINKDWIKKEKLVSLLTTFLNQCFIGDIISANDMYQLLLSLS